MNQLKFAKAVTEIYFTEKDIVWRKSKQCWNFIFLMFLFLYLFQIFTAYCDWLDLVVYQLAAENEILSADRFWQRKVYALILQGVVLLGVFVRFLAAHFRGRWSVRFGESGEFIAFAAVVRHFLWTVEIRSQAFDGNGCCSSPLEGTHFYNGEIITLFFFGWVIYKILLLIAVTWKTVRK